MKKLLLLFLFGLSPLLLAQDFDDVEIQTLKVRDNIYMLVGQVATSLCRPVTMASLLSIRSMQSCQARYSPLSGSYRTGPYGTL